MRSLVYNVAHGAVWVVLLIAALVLTPEHELMDFLIPAAFCAVAALYTAYCFGQPPPVPRDDTDV